METSNNQPETRIESRIRELQVYLQSFRETALTGEFVINGLLLERIPIDVFEAKKRIKNEMVDLISKEINRLQVIRENDGDIPPGEEPDQPLTVGDIKTAIVDNQIDQDAAVEYLLQERYFSEFQVIDNLSQHPNGYNFQTWLKRKKLLQDPIKKFFKR